ncbi:cadherin-like beta sandwich domain-containing protein [Paenibacillus sp. LjRoot153]
MASASTNVKAMVSGGYNHALALKSDGTVWAWGDNTNGQLGDGTSEGQQPSPRQVKYSNDEPLTDFIKVVAGENHSMALRSDGTLWEWGDWVRSDNNVEDILSPRQVTLPNSVKDMATGGFFCLALLEDGTVWGWGQNNWGQLAAGASGVAETFYNTPVQVVGPYGIGYLTDVVKLISSDSFAAALTGDGRLYGWGNNYSNPLALASYTENDWMVSVPTLITAFPEPVVDLDSGAYGLGAVLKSGKVWATALPFVSNSQVFTGDTYYSIPPVTDAKQVVMGGNSIAALTASGKVWTKGVNGTDDYSWSTFILGNPDVGYQSDQAQVKGPNGEGYLTDAMYLSGGNNTAYVIRKDGTLWSWGSNQNGQLGIGTPGEGESANASKVPVAVTVEGAPFQLAPSADASLRTLSLNGEALSGFMPDIKQYEVNADSGTASVTIIAEPSDLASVVSVNHAPVGGDGSATVALQAGSNVVGIEITAPDGVSKELYSVKLHVGSGADIPTNDWEIRLDDDNSAMTQSVNLPDGGSIGIQRLPTSDSQIIRSKYNGEILKVLHFSNHKTVAVYPLSDLSGNFALVSNVSNGIELVQMDPDLNLLTPSTVLVVDDVTWTGKTALKAKPSSDGGVIIIGKATQASSGWTMPYIVKLDSSWHKVMETGFVVSEDFPDVINDVTEDGAGGYVVTGTLSVGADSPSLLAVHLASDGTMDNVKSFQRDVVQEGQSIVHTGDGGYVITGTSASDRDNTILPGIWLLKLDSSLNLVWDTYTESNGPASVKSLIPLAEGGYAAAGMRDGMSGMTVFSKDGYEIWHVSDSGGREWLHAARTLDGGYMTSGSTPDGKAFYKKWSGPNLRLSYIQVGFEEKTVPVTVANPQVADVISFEVDGSSSSVAVVPYLENPDMKLTVEGAVHGSGDTINVEWPAGTTSKTIGLTVQTPDGRYARSYSVELKAIPINKDALKTAIDEAQSFLDMAVGGTEVGQYPVSVIESLHTLLQDANMVYSEIGSSQSSVDNAAWQLSEQLSYMPYEQIPYAEKVALASSLLQASQLLKQTVQGTDPGNTPPSAFESLQAAYDVAKAVMMNVRAGQELVDTEFGNLLDSIASFQNASILPSPAFFADFENNDGGFHTEGANSTWAYGTPDYSKGPEGAHSGTAVWGTNLTGNYNDEENSYLISGPIDASGNSIKKVVVSAYVWEQTENNYDYSYIDVSKDGGQSWQTLHEFTGGNHSYEGEGEGEGEVYYPPVSTDWKKLIFELDPSYAVPDLQIRFHLTTDGWVNEPGIYVDDVAVYVVKKALKTALLTADKTLAVALEGQLPGQYRYGVRNMLQSAYETARQVNEDPAATEAKRETQLNRLEQSLHIAEGLKVSTSLGATVPNGSIVSYGGQKWIMLDHDSGKMISSNEIGTSQWSEDGSNTFNPNTEGSLAYQLNHSFLMSLENSDWVQEHAWDVSGLDGRIWNGTGSVSTKVGLLSANEYLQYGTVYPGGSGMLDHLRDVWTLTPATFIGTEIGTTDQGLYQVNDYGNLSIAAPRAYKHIRPVIYLRTDLVQAAGSGSDEDPFMLTPDTDEHQISLTTAILSDWFRGINPGIDSVTNVVYAERLTLPLEDAAGVAIQWSSNQPNVIDPLTGVVKKPLPGQPDTEVELSAVVSKNMSTRNVSFTLVVKGNPITEAEIVAGDKSALTLASILGSNVDESQVTTNLFLPTAGALGSTIEWTSDNTVIAPDGTVTRDTYTEGDQTVRLTATVSKGTASESVVFTLVVKANAISEAEIVAGDKIVLTLASIIGSNADESHVMTNLVLPTTGTLGSAIAWTSNNAAIAPDGTVTRGTHAEGDRTVQLTATLSKGTASESVVFTLVVKAIAISEAEIVAADKSALTLASILGSNVDESNITTNLVLPTTGTLGSAIKWTSNNAAIAPNGTVTRGTYAEGDRTVQLTATLTKDTASESVIFTLVVKANAISEAEIVAADKETLTLASIIGSNADASHVMTNLVLPTTGTLGSAIEWTSNNAAITPDGKVTRGSHTEGDRTVQLTATVSKGTASESVSFTLVVKANAISEAEIVAADKEALTLASILGSNADEGHVTTNLVLPTTGTFGSAIVWSSDNSVISPDGTVTRPTTATGKAIVNLTATLTKGSAELNVVFEITVLSKDPIPNGTPTVVNADEPLIFADGIVIDLQGIVVPAGTTVTANSVSPVLTGTSLQQVGPVVEFRFQGMQTGQLEAPVKLQFPIAPGTDLSKVGIFYFDEMTGKWEYQRTNIDANGHVSAFVTHFSTYGVFIADQASAPIANPASGSILQAGMSITLTTATGGAEIRYTTDGSEPASASTLYDSAHIPTASAGNGLIVKAIVQKDGMIDSIVQTFTYTISALSDNAKLSGILASTDSSFSNLLAVTPDGSAGTTVYAATVSNVVDSVYVNAFAEHSGAHVSILKDGLPVTVSNAVYLNVGVNPILILVTAENGDRQEYTLNVNRLGSGNADISGIRYGDEPLLQSGNTFMLNVGWDMATVNVLVSLSDPTAQMTVTGATYDMNVIHIPDLSFDASQNIYPIIVTAQDGTAKTYSLQIVRSPEPSKDILDTNHDGFISIDDVSKLVLEQFDVDGNGFDSNDVMYLLRQIEPRFVKMK